MELTRPVLILHGAEDPSPVWAADSLLAALPNARRAVIEDAGDMPWTERPSAVAGAGRGFLHELQDGT